MMTHTMQRDSALFISYMKAGLCVMEENTGDGFLNSLDMSA